MHITIILLYAQCCVLFFFSPPSTVERASPWVVKNSHATVLLLAMYYSREGLAIKPLCLPASPKGACNPSSALDAPLRTEDAEIGARSNQEGQVP